MITANRAKEILSTRSNWGDVKLAYKPSYVGSSYQTHALGLSEQEEKQVCDLLMKHGKGRHTRLDVLLWLAKKDR